MSTDELRRAIEALPGHKEMTYYHRWAAGIRNLNPRSMQKNLRIIMKRQKVTTEIQHFLEIRTNLRLLSTVLVLTIPLFLSKMLGISRSRLLTNVKV